MKPKDHDHSGEEHKSDLKVFDALNRGTASVWSYSRTTTSFYYVDQQSILSRQPLISHTTS